MEAKQLREHTWAIRIARGERLVSSLEDFCQQKDIAGGFFFGVGAVGFVELAHYDVGEKNYQSQEFEEPLELVSLEGSIGCKKDSLIVHAHAVLSRPDMETIGGHLVEGVVSGTAEIYLITSSPLEKEPDEITGLDLFSFSS
ncbi:MAG: PPC domain-containing DNA-binding protein [Patescibacteria group bacterium]